MDIDRTKRHHEMATEETLRKIGARMDQGEGMLAIFSMVATLILLIIFSHLADIRDRAEPLIWICTIAVGAIVYLAVRSHRNRWFSYHADAMRRLDREEAE
jgi:hypothetical protein